MNFTINYNTEKPVKRPTKDGKYLEIKNGKLVGEVYVRNSENIDDCYVRIYNLEDSEPLSHPWYDDTTFAYIL